jgi:hypothetical protein
MKSLSSSHEMIFNSLALLIGKKRAVFPGDLFFNIFKTFFHYLRGYGRILIMNGHLKQSTMEEFPFSGGGEGIGQRSLRSADFDDAQFGLFARNVDGEVERVSIGPAHPFFRRIPPVHSKGWLQKFLSLKHAETEQKPNAGEAANRFSCHEFGGSGCRCSLGGLNPFRKPRSACSGMALVEATAALSLLTVVGLILFTLVMNVVTPRQYALQQVLSNAYLTFERAKAERIPFDTLMADDSPWPIFPETAKEDVEIGKLPGGRPVKGQVIRTRYADETNFPIDGGSGTEQTNPAAMKVWRVQSVLRYNISQRTYMKSRTVIRAQ